MMILSSDDDLFGYAVVGFFGGLFCFVKGFRVFRKYKVLADTPVMPVRSIAMGHVEIYGRATSEQTVLSPVTHTPCFFYQVKIEHWQRGNKGGGRWAHYRTDANGVRFWIEDDTGRVAVDLRGVEVNLRQHSRREVGGLSVKWSGSSLFGGSTKAARAFGPSEAELLDYIRRGEIAIPVATRVAEPAFFADADGATPPPSQEQAERELEAFREEMRRRRASPKSGSGLLNFFTTGHLRFGSIGGGRYRLTECVVEPDRWYHIAGCCAENPIPQDETDRHLIRKGENEPTFIISSEAEAATEQGLKRRAALYVLGGGGVSLVSLAVILGKLGWL
jgi:hypothetical protein